MILSVKCVNKIYEKNCDKKMWKKSMKKDLCGTKNLWKSFFCVKYFILKNLPLNYHSPYMCIYKKEWNQKVTNMINHLTSSWWAANHCQVSSQWGYITLNRKQVYNRWAVNQCQLSINHLKPAWVRWHLMMIGLSSNVAIMMVF